MKEFFWKVWWVLIGGFTQGVGMGLFLFPQSIPSGGAGGIAILLNHLFHIHKGVALWVVNFAMLMIAMKYLGKRFTVWTILGITMTSISVYFFELYIEIVHRNIFYDLVIGSIFLGLGIGILMRQRVSNGGVGVIAFMITHGRNILPGKPLFLINCSIFAITAAVIDWKIFILAFISQWISTRMVDLIYRFDFVQVYSFQWRRKS